MRRRPVVRPLRLGAAAILALLAVAAAVEPAEERAWSPPRAVFSGTPLSGPLLATDPAGGVHLFVPTRPDDTMPKQVTYLRRLPGGGWSEPVTILGRAEDPVALYGVAIDDRGWAHFVYQGGPRRQVEHRRVYVGSIADPEAWFRAAVVSEDSALRASLFAAPDGSLHVLTAGRNHHLSYVRSDDVGRTWSTPVRITHHDAAKEACDNPTLAIDGRGRIHAVWNQAHLPKGWPPSGVYYSRSLDQGATWSAPLELAGDDYALINVAARGAGEVHLVWGAVARIGVRMHQWSNDGGDTWTAPQRITTKISGGITGVPGVAFDGAGRLHVITSVDGPKFIERIFHLLWDGSAWSEPALVSGGTDAADSVEFPALALAEGNRLYVAYEGDYRSIWFSEHRTAAPPAAPRPLPTVASDLRSLYADASLPLRILLALAALLLLQGIAALAWRGVRRGAAR